MPGSFLLIIDSGEEQPSRIHQYAPDCGSHSSLRDHCGEFEECMIRVFFRLELHKVELEF